MSSSFQHCLTQCCCRFVVFISLSTLNVNFIFWCRRQICKRYTQQQLVLKSLLVFFYCVKLKIILWNLSCQFVLVGCIVRRNYLTVATVRCEKKHIFKICWYLQRYFCNALHPHFGVFIKFIIFSRFSLACQFWYFISVRIGVCFFTHLTIPRSIVNKYTLQVSRTLKTGKAFK